MNPLHVRFGTGGCFLALQFGQLAMFPGCDRKVRSREDYSWNNVTRIIYSLLPSIGLLPAPRFHPSRSFGYFENNFQFDRCTERETRDAVDKPTRVLLFSKYVLQ